MGQDSISSLPLLVNVTSFLLGCKPLSRTSAAIPGLQLSLVSLSDRKTLETR